MRVTPSPREALPLVSQNSRARINRLTAMSGVRLGAFLAQPATTGVGLDLRSAFYQAVESSSGEVLVGPMFLSTAAAATLAAAGQWLLSRRATLKPPVRVLRRPTRGQESRVRGRERGTASHLDPPLPSRSARGGRGGSSHVTKARASRPGPKWVASRHPPTVRPAARPYRGSGPVSGVVILALGRSNRPPPGVYRRRDQVADEFGHIVLLPGQNMPDSRTHQRVGIFPIWGFNPH